MHQFASRSHSSTRSQMRLCNSNRLVSAIVASLLTFASTALLFNVLSVSSPMQFDPNDTQFHVTSNSQTWHLFTSECSNAHDWRSIAISHSHNRLSQAKGHLVRLMACPDVSYAAPSPPSSHYRIVRSNSTQLNTPQQLWHWLSRAGAVHNHDIITLFDIDHIFIGSPSSKTVKQGVTVGVLASFSPDLLQFISKKFCEGTCLSLIQQQRPISKPYIATAFDLKKITPLWIELCRKMSTDTDLLAKIEQKSDMEDIAFVVAALHHGIRLETAPLSVSSPEGQQEDEQWELAQWYSSTASPLAFLHLHGSHSLGSLSWSTDRNNINLKDCDPLNALFEESEGHDLKILNALEGTPLGPNLSGQNRASRTRAREAFLFKRGPLMVNEAFREFFEHSCPWKARFVPATKPGQPAPETKQRRLWTVMSTQCNEFNDWNAIVTAYSHQRLDIQGPIVRLMACNDDSYEPPEIANDDYTLVRVKNYEFLDDDHFPPRNKGHNVDEWLNGDSDNLPDDDDVIALIDPDQIFIGHLNISSVRRGHGIAASYSIGHQFLEITKHLCAGACDNIEDKEALAYGAPYIVTAGDLKKIAPLWVELTALVRKDMKLRSSFGWLSEMYTYILAALRLGISHEKLDLMISFGRDYNEPWYAARWHSPMKNPLKFVHFCQRYTLGSLSWSKHDYHQFDLRTCDRSLKFQEPLSLNNSLTLKRVEGMPLDKAPEGVSIELLEEARAAFLYMQVIPVANNAFQAYFEEYCTWNYTESKALN